MKKPLLAVLSVLILFSCAPVLRYDLMGKGILNARLSELKENPVSYREKLFILGGIIVNTTVTKEGSLIEAIYVPVDFRGYLKSSGISNGRFLAIYKGFLDPVIFNQEREVTIAGIFKGTRTGNIGEMEYTYPFFEIEEIYLWEKRQDEYYPPYLYYPYWRYELWWHDYW